MGRAIGPAGGLGAPFYLLFLSGVLSDIGGFTTHTALILHVYKLTGGSTRFMGLIAMASLLPMMLSAPLGGVWAERYPRLRVMIGNDLVRMPLILGMMFTDSVWLLLVLQALVCASTALFMPSRQSILPELVPPEHLELGNALNSGVLSVVHVLSPILGAYLYARAGSLTYVVVIEALAYLVSALLLSRIVESKRLPRGGGQASMFEEAIAGFRYVRAEADLRQIFLILSASGVSLGLVLPLLRPFATEALRGGDTTYTAMIAWFGVGGIFGPLVGYIVGRALGLGRTLLLCFFLEAMVLTLWPHATAAWQASTGLFAWGIVTFALIPCYTSYLHIYGRREFMGRTFALFDQTGYLPQIVSATIITILGDRLPVVLILSCAGAAYLVIVLISLPSRGSLLLRTRSGDRSGLSSGSHPPVNS